MTMGILWTGMVAAALVCGAVNGRLTAVTAAALEGAGAAVELTLAMAGALCLWSGVLEVMARSGMADGLSRLLRPVLRRLLPRAQSTDVYFRPAPETTARRWLPSVPTSAPICWGWATPRRRRASGRRSAWRRAAAVWPATSCAAWWC